MQYSLVALLATASAVNAAAQYNTTTSCPAPGTTDSQGRYSCNPAHSYPNGQTCESVDGCYYLKYPSYSTSSVPPKSTYSASSTTSTPPKSTYSATPQCPAPGATDSQGRYSCNPAHSYPNGQTCELVGGCYYLKYPSYPTSSAPPKSTYTATAPPQSTYSATPQCPAPGTTDSQGRYLCNPAHAYPAGQTCTLSNGCYYLNVPKYNTTTATPPKPSNTKEVYTGAASTLTAFSGLAALVGFAMLAL